MLDQLYQLLNAAGYPHPLHPAVVHMPIGLVIGGLVLSVSAIAFRRDRLSRAAWYCGNIALAFMLPTVALGVADWQHFFAGGPVPGIPTKIVLATVLFAVLAVSLLAGWLVPAAFRSVGPALFSIGTVLAIFLGFIGGNLVYGGRTPVASAGYQAGEAVFRANCAGCHAGGGNIIAPNLPLVGAPQLASQSAFDEFIRKPHMPDGKGGRMPGFQKARISDSDAIALYNYIVQVLGNPHRTPAPAIR